MTEVFFDSDGAMAVRTDANGLMAFQEEMAGLLDSESEWDKHTIFKFIETCEQICLKIRGYKAAVEETRVIYAGSRKAGKRGNEACASYDRWDHTGTTFANAEEEKILNGKTQADEEIRLEVAELVSEREDRAIPPIS